MPPIAKDTREITAVDAIVAASSCEGGMPDSAGQVCCIKDCGRCGGPGCRLRRGGSLGCCAGNILSKNHMCSSNHPPCILQKEVVRDPPVVAVVAIDEKDSFIEVDGPADTATAAVEAERKRSAEAAAAAAAIITSAIANVKVETVDRARANSLNVDTYQEYYADKSEVKFAEGNRAVQTANNDVYQAFPNSLGGMSQLKDVVDKTKEYDETYGDGVHARLNSNAEKFKSP